MRGLSLLVLVWPLGAMARPELRPFPEDLLRGYATALAHAEASVVETADDGRPLQMTMLGFTAAPPAMVHDLVAHPEDYPRFVKNLSRSEVVRQADGTLRHRWRVSFPIGGFDGEDEYRFDPGPAAPIHQHAVGPRDHAVLRWEFIAAPGGGTVVVNYGFYDPLDSTLLARMTRGNPAYEAGFNLAGALTILRALLAEAGRRAHAAGITVATPVEATRAPDLRPLLERGTVVLVRSTPSGDLVDVSVVERIGARRDRLLAQLRAPETWPRFMSSIKRCDVLARDRLGLDYRMTVSGFLFDVETSYRMNFTEGGTDTLATGGFMLGSRYRFDLGEAGPDATVVVWRGNLHLGHTSSLLRALFRVEPSLEHAANVSVGLITVRAMANQAGRP